MKAEDSREEIHLLLKDFTLLGERYRAEEWSPPPFFFDPRFHKRALPFDQKPTFKRKKLFQGAQRAVPQGGDVLFAPFTVTVTVMGP